MIIGEYNTVRPGIKLKEYGRNVQKLVDFIRTIPDKEKRTQMAFTLIDLIRQLTPSLKDQPDNPQRIWDDLYIIADFNLDVNNPYPVPLPEVLFKKPMSTSQVLHALQRWVQRTDRGWTATDTAGLTRWLAEQPPPGRTATTWLGLDDPAPTATRVAAWLTARHVGYAISSDVAADFLAPWARPTRGLVYVEQALDLTPLGLTPAPPDAATLELVVPDDPFVLRDARLLPSDLVTAHPWRVWADTLARGNADAADALRAHLLGVRTT